jgi:prolyl-tRNA synthetase
VGIKAQLFLRTTEFLWQEGHTAHATFEEADARARQMLEVYRQVAEDYLAVPVFMGIKSEAEKFAGGLYTYALEAMMQDGKALQFCTSHNLGKNFAKAFGIAFTKEDNTSDFVWQTSWGWSTRTIGGLIMTHSDDKGLVLPPRVAPIHVIIIPIWSSDEEKSAVYKKAEGLKKSLEDFDKIVVKIDDHDNLRPGEKYYYWEKRGVPVRLELGPKDLAKGSAVMVRRDTSEKSSVDMKKLPEVIKKTLETVQVDLFNKAKAFQEKRTVSVDDWEDFVKEIDKGNFVLAHWSGEREEEDEIKSKTKATIRCIPFDQKKEEGKSIFSKKPSKGRVVLLGRISYSLKKNPKNLSPA